MQQVLTRLKAYGIVLNLKPEDNTSLEYSYPDGVFDSLSPQQQQAAYSLVDDNEAEIIVALQVRGQPLIDKVSATKELVELLIGREVNFQGKVVKLSQLAATIEAHGVLWSVKADDLAKGDIVKVSGYVDGVLVQSKFPFTVSVEAETVTKLKEVF